MKPTVLSWSSGKDSMLTLLKMLESPQHQVVGLFTSHVKGKVPFQEVPLELVQAQAKSLGLPLLEIELPQVFPTNEIYKQLIIQGLLDSNLQFEAVAFGDMFLNGIADYRKSYIEPQGWEVVLPLLGQSSVSLAAEIIDRGIKATINTVDTSQLSGHYCGLDYDNDLVQSLPSSCDPCGENGEFHSFVWGGPKFFHDIEFHTGKIYRQSRFHFCSLSAI